MLFRQLQLQHHSSRQMLSRKPQRTIFSTCSVLLQLLLQILPLQHSLNRVTLASCRVLLPLNRQISTSLNPSNSSPICLVNLTWIRASLHRLRSHNSSHLHPCSRIWTWTLNLSSRINRWLPNNLQTLDLASWTSHQASQLKLNNLPLIFSVVYSSNHHNSPRHNLPTKTCLVVLAWTRQIHPQHLSNSNPLLIHLGSPQYHPNHSHRRNRTSRQTCLETWICRARVLWPQELHSHHPH